MPTCHDVAKYILERNGGAMSSMKLQKLLYYSQAWNLVWEEKPLFPEAIQAWANGPVVPEVYDAHRGLFAVDASTYSPGNSGNLTAKERENIDKVLGFYGDKNAQWLSNLTHQESPWLDARGDLPVGARSSNVITTAAMHEYYSALP